MSDEFSSTVMGMAKAYSSVMDSLKALGHEDLAEDVVKFLDAEDQIHFNAIRRAKSDPEFTHPRTVEAFENIISRFILKDDVRLYAETGEKTDALWQAIAEELCPSFEELEKFAKDHLPPQSWFDEEFPE